MESAVSFAPLRPADFVNFAGRGGALRGWVFQRDKTGKDLFWLELLELLVLLELLQLLVLFELLETEAIV